MPLFMFVGGYVAQWKYRKATWGGFPKYLQSKFVGLMVPYVVWGVLVGKVLQRYDWLSAQAWMQVVKECVDIVVYYKGLWFLMAFFSLSIGFYLVSIVLNKKKSGGVIALALLALIYMGLYKVTGCLLWKISLQYIPVFGLGCLTCGSEKLYKWISDKRTMNWAMPCFLLVASFHLWNLNNWLKMPAGLLAVPVFIGLCQHMNFGHHLKKSLLTLGRYSLAIYCMHGFFLAYLPYHFGDDLYMGWVAIGLAVVVCALCVGVTAVLEKSSVLNCLLFGKLPRKNA
jgi:fucose 4-O-acetylase-like acetyltransferase